MTNILTFEGQSRQIIDMFAIDAARVLFVLDATGDSPAIAVTGARFEDTGLFTGLKGHHRVDQPEHFAAKVEMLIELGVYDD